MPDVIVARTLGRAATGEVGLDSYDSAVETSDVREPEGIAAEDTRAAVEAVIEGMDAVEVVRATDGCVAHVEGVIVATNAVVCASLMVSLVWRSYGLGRG